MLLPTEGWYVTIVSSSPIAETTAYLSAATDAVDTTKPSDARAVAKTFERRLIVFLVSTDSGPRASAPQVGARTCGTVSRTALRITPFSARTFASAGTAYQGCISVGETALGMVAVSVACFVRTTAPVWRSTKVSVRYAYGDRKPRPDLPVSVCTRS